MTIGNAMKALEIGMSNEISQEQEEWLKDRMEEYTGTRNLEEANRRMDVLYEWRYNDD